MMKNESKHKYAQVELPNGAIASILMPDIQADVKMCIIAEPVLRILLDSLPKVDLLSIKSGLMNSIEYSHNLPEMMDVCKEFITVQMSINLIQNYIAEVDNSKKEPTRKSLHEDVFSI